MAMLAAGLPADLAPLVVDLGAELDAGDVLDQRQPRTLPAFARPS